MRSMMEGVVIKPYGTGHKYARLLGYTSAGKTGTAQIYDYRLQQYTHLYNASFMGFAPVTNPRIVIVVTINGTEGTAGYGGPTSAPVFREVAAAGLARHGRAERFARNASSRGWRSGRRKRRGDRRSWFFHPSPAGPSGRCRCRRRPTGGFRKQCFGPAGSFSPEWKLDAGFCRAARTGLSREDRAQRDSASSRAGHPGGVYRKRSRARAGSRARRDFAFGELGFACNLAVSGAHDNRADPPGRAAPEGAAE